MERSPKFQLFFVYFYFCFPIFLECIIYVLFLGFLFVVFLFNYVLIFYFIFPMLSLFPFMCPLLFPFSYLYLFSVFNRFKEHSFLRGLHRLISRSLQALSLIELLTSIQNSEENEDKTITIQKKEKNMRMNVSESSMHLGNILFSSLVVSEKVHDSMKMFLVGVLGNFCADGFVQEADRLVEKLTEKCYLVSKLYFIVLFIQYFSLSFSVFSSFLCLSLSLSLSLSLFLSFPLSLSLYLSPISSSFSVPINITVLFSIFYDFTFSSILSPSLFISMRPYWLLSKFSQSYPYLTILVFLFPLLDSSFYLSSSFLCLLIFP